VISWMSSPRSGRIGSGLIAGRRRGCASDGRAAGGPAIMFGSQPRDC
jgi:hypothetical protein